MDSVETQALIVEKIESITDLSILWIINDFITALIGNTQNE